MATLILVTLILAVAKESHAHTKGLAIKALNPNFQAILCRESKVMAF